jgi:DNA polymerase-3 subunit gamma/tau
MTADEASAARRGDQTGSYRVLARKYRPATFGELIGQTALVRTLTNALNSGRLAQAYMLSGVRGVGKTTTARIIARALNCVGPDGQGGLTAEPCGVCEHCIAIAEDRHLDVIEMDGATHTGKDEIRELLDGVRYRPTTGRYKVYIIDEVHMLSEKAFNALLKTLEEPPAHVRFVFATTEIRKVPVTVLSRCQRFDLRRVDGALIARHLGEVAAREGGAVSLEALRLLARAADGSVRDGLSLLDQALALAAGQTVEAAMVREMLGLADRTAVFDLLDALFAGDAARALALLGEQYEAGAEPLAVIEDLLELAHWLTRLKVTPTVADAADVPEAERVRGREIAGRLDMAEVTRAWQLLLKGLNEVRYAPQPLPAAEMVLIRFCYAARLPTPAEALRQLADPAADPARPTPPAAAASRPSPSPEQGPSFERRAERRVATTTTATTTAATTPAAEAPRLVPQPSPARPPKAEAAAVRDATRPPLRRFEDVVDWLAEEREMILHGHMLVDVRLVDFQPGRIELRLEETAPRDLAQRLSRFLSERTGERWLVTVSAERGGATLAEQRRAAEAAALARAADHPLVKAVLDAFPGARLEGLRTAPAVADDGGDRGADGDDDIVEDDDGGNGNGR